MDFFAMKYLNRSIVFDYLQPMHIYMYDETSFLDLKSITFFFSFFTRI